MKPKLFVPAIFILASFTFLTVAYPLVDACGNVAVALVMRLRHKRLLLAEAAA